MNEEYKKHSTLFLPNYNRLNELIKPNLKYNTKKANIIIDLNYFISFLFRDEFLVDIGENLKHRNKSLLISILNNIGFYRNYLWKYYEIETEFYIVYSFNEYLENYPNYKNLYYNKVGILDNLNLEYIKERKIAYEYVQDNLKTLNSIIYYVPKSYCINTNEVLKEVVIYKILEETSKNDYNLIVSNSPINYQFVNDNTNILKLKGCNSSLINKNNFYNRLTRKRDIKYDLSIDFYKVILSIIGDLDYNIEGIKGYSYIKSIKLLEGLKDLNNNHSNIEHLLRSYPNILKDNQDLIIKNYNNFCILDIKSKILLYDKYLDYYKKDINMGYILEEINRRFLDNDDRINIETIFASIKE
jgi:hypothetical protein